MSADNEYKYDPRVRFPTPDYKEVRSIRQDSDNQYTVTMGDGSQQVYETDAFHPEKGRALKTK